MSNTVGISDRRMRTRRIDKLNGSIFGAHPEAKVDDLVLSRDLNRFRILENAAAGVDIKAIASTTTAAISPGGARLFGDGIDETDSGMIATSGGPYFSMIATNQTLHTAAIGTAAALAPNTQGPLRMYARFDLADLSEMRLFFGFCGTAADAFVARTTGTGTTITLVDNDLVALIMDSGLTDADGLFFAFNKANAAADQDTTDDDVDPSFTMVANTVYYAAMEIDKLGNVAWAIQTADGGIAASGDRALASTPGTALAGVLAIESLDADGTEQLDGVAWGIDYYGDNS